jgi:hypothetical protein
MPPKRPATTGATAENTKKRKTDTTSIRTSPQGKANNVELAAGVDDETHQLQDDEISVSESSTKSNTEDEEGSWEILGEDTREPLKIGVAAPKRLTLRFRHKKNKKIRSFSYKKKKADEVDWNNQDDVKDIQKWRNQISKRKEFPPMVSRTQWTAFETGYLELFLRKIQLAAETDDTVVMPHTKKILKAFNDYFESRNDIKDKKGNVLDSMTARSSGSLTSHMNRPNSKLRKLRDAMSDLPISNGDDVYMPEITDIEIEVYINNKTVTTDSRHAEAGEAASGVIGKTQSGIPEDNQEAIRLHREENNRKPLDTTWIHTGSTDLKKRIVKYKYTPKLLSHVFYADQIANVNTTNENWHERSLRVDGAAAVNALINAADIPPLGYTGDIPHLVENRLLPNDEQVLAESRATAMQKLQAMREANAKVHVKEKKNLPIQRDVNDDSDSTGDESVGDMDA